MLIRGAVVHVRQPHKIFGRLVLDSEGGSDERCEREGGEEGANAFHEGAGGLENPKGQRFKSQNNFHPSRATRKETNEFFVALRVSRRGGTRLRRAGP